MSYYHASKHLTKEKENGVNFFFFAMLVYFLISLNVFSLMLYLLIMHYLYWLFPSVTLKVSVGINIFFSAISSFSCRIIMLLGALNEEFLLRMEVALHGK